MLALRSALRFLSLARASAFAASLMLALWSAMRFLRLPRASALLAGLWRDFLLRDLRADFVRAGIARNGEGREDGEGEDPIRFSIPDESLSRSLGRRGETGSSF